MINQGFNVPDNTIAIFKKTDFANLTDERVANLIKPNVQEREWFTNHFYRCLPLKVGNLYGFSLFSEWSFAVEWDGSNSKEGTKILCRKEDESNLSNLTPLIESHFGHGVVTISFPFWVRTPPNVNLMTINPPNYVLPNLSVMTGVIETDNLRRDFTLNLKIQTPFIQTAIEAGFPIATIIPIPRYFVDNFSLKSAKTLFEDELIEEEEQAFIDTLTKRYEVEYKNKLKVGMDYFIGQDVYGNKFPDHQVPINKIKKNKLGN